jgi:hypothetical protein
MLDRAHFERSKADFLAIVFDSAGPEEVVEANISDHLIFWWGYLVRNSSLKVTLSSTKKETPGRDFGLFHIVIFRGRAEIG